MDCVFVQNRGRNHLIVGFALHVHKPFFSRNWFEIAFPVPISDLPHVEIARSAFREAGVFEKANGAMIALDSSFMVDEVYTAQRLLYSNGKGIFLFGTTTHRF